METKAEPDRETFVWSVIYGHGDGDGPFVATFESEARARQYADLTEGATVTPQLVMNDSAAGQFIIDSAGD